MSAMSGTWGESARQFTTTKPLDDLGRRHILRGKPGVDPRLLQMRQSAGPDFGKDGVRTLVANENVDDGPAIEPMVLLEFSSAGFGIADHHPLGLAEVR